MVLSSVIPCGEFFFKCCYIFLFRFEGKQYLEVGLLKFLVIEQAPAASSEQGTHRYLLNE